MVKSILTVHAPKMGTDISINSITHFFKYHNKKIKTRKNSKFRGFAQYKSGCRPQGQMPWMDNEK